MRHFNKKVLDAAAVAASIVGDKIRAHDVDKLAAHIANTATITTGVFKLQGSCAEDPGSGDWVDIANATVNVTAAATQGFTVSGIGYIWIRPVYSQASGTGTLTAWISAKGD